MKNENNKNPVLILGLLVLVIFIMLILRNSGLYTVVSSDESIYSKSSRLLPLANSVVPSYIYFGIYRFSNICGDEFYSCVKIFNALFFVASAPFIYLTARRVCTISVSSIVVILTLLGPINTYTSYFMPEAVYFFTFWLLTWFVLRLDNLSKLSQWCFAGVLLGISALIKPHAFLLLPAFVAYILYIRRNKEGVWVLRAVKSAGVFVLSTFVTKLLMGYLLVGQAGLSIFGNFYSSIASSQISNVQHYIKLIELSAKNINGHVLAICLMFGLGVALVAVSTLSSILSKEKINANQNVSFYAFVILVNLVLVVGLFTASVTNTGASETIERLHMRYYNFALPLLFIVAATQLSLEHTAHTFKWRVIAALPVGAIILYAIYSRLRPYTSNFVDSPELRGFTGNLTAFNYLSVLSLSCLALWVFAARAGAKVFVYIFMPIAVIFSSLHVNHELRQRINADVYDRAGIFTKQYLSSEELSKLVIVGPEYGFLFRALFHIDNPQVTLVGIPQGSTYNPNDLPVGKEWVLAIGDSILLDGVVFQVPMSGFKLARVTRPDTFDFKKTVWPGVLSSMHGLSQPEAWGTWSSGGLVTFEFSVPLPEKFSVHLIAYAFGPNVGKDFVVHVGESAVKFKLGDSPEERVFEFSNPNRSSTMKINIPLPTSPKELGLSGETRSLGIAFLKLQIVPN